MGENSPKDEGCKVIKMIDFRYLRGLVSLPGNPFYEEEQEPQRPPSARIEYYTSPESDDDLPPAA